MIIAYVCLVIALVAAPPPAARRRFGATFAGPGAARKPLSRIVISLLIVIGLAAVVLVGIGPLTAAVLMTGTIAIRTHRLRRDRQRDTESANLLDALEAVIAELRVGAHPSSAAEVAARESRGLAAQAFTVSAARSRLGGSGATALHLPNSVITAELARVATAWQVAEQHGLALAELLSAARTDLLARTRFRSRTTAALAGARATATVLAYLPLLGIALGQLMGAAPLTTLFTTPAGTLLLPLGTALACAGVLWTDAITRKVLT
ncbi:type II secretion system F family protein [Nocardia sp. XZ_19_385]|uniref:type II secretion system F family protein n=1 Tax=Nocardia sp. XZ_19_385 TaxID=2769488 RepID=UPI00188F635E|nr:type II secretion system F family protein [Nocardia sp. XZ_19_385]